MFLISIGAMFEPTEELAAEEGSDGESGYIPAYGKLFDVNVVPRDGMGYLGNFIGVELPADDEEWRAILRAESGLARD